MPKTLTYSLTTLATFLMGTAVFAHNEKGMKRPQLPNFEQLDVNSDDLVSKTEIEQYGKKTFLSMDANEDNKLSLEELMAERRTRAELFVTRMIEKLDADNDGHLTYEEMQQNRVSKRMNKIFDRLDRDQDGFISKQEMAEMKTLRKKNRRDAENEN